jgi:hypothetical protein
MVESWITKVFPTAGEVIGNKLQVKTEAFKITVRLKTIKLALRKINRTLADGKHAPTYLPGSWQRTSQAQIFLSIRSLCSIFATCVHTFLKERQSYWMLSAGDFICSMKQFTGVTLHSTALEPVDALTPPSSFPALRA